MSMVHSESSFSEKPGAKGAGGWESVASPNEGENSSGSDDSNAPKPTIEDIYTMLGVGRFQWVALLILGMGNASDAVEILAIGFILPELHLVPLESAFLASAVFAGMLFGGKNHLFLLLICLPVSTNKRGTCDFKAYSAACAATASAGSRACSRRCSSTASPGCSQHCVGTTSECSSL
jgi:hypothetical protein